MKGCRTRGRLGRVLHLVSLAALLSSCRSDTSVPLPEVEYSGCWAVYFPGPVCALWPVSNPVLRLWVKADPGAKVEIRAGDRLLTASGEEWAGGRRYRLSLPQEDSGLTVRLRQADGAYGPSWSMALTRTEMPAWLSRFGELAGSGKRRAARELLQQRWKEAPRSEQGILLRSFALLARLEGNSGEHESYLQRGIAADRAENCLSCEVEKATLLADSYMGQGRFSEARKVLESLALPPGAPVDSKCLVAYLKGVLASRVGDYRTALEQLRKDIALAEKVWMEKARWKAELALANLLQDLGRSHDASLLFKRLHTAPHVETPCDKGDLLTSWAWSWLLAREAGEEAEDPTPMLKEALAAYNPSCAPPERRFNARLNLVLALQQAERWSEDRQALDQARPLASHASLRQRLWWYDLEARTAIAAGRPERGLRLYEELAELAERSQSFEGRFRAAFGRARAELALGRRAAALAALAQADRCIDEQSRNVPAYEGRDTVVGQREQATRLYLQLLLDAGQTQEAFRLARRARSRLLRQLTVRDRLALLTPREQGIWDQALSGYRALRNEVDQQTADEWQLPGDQRERARKDRASQLAQAREDLDRAMAELGIPRDDDEIHLLPPRPGEVVLTYHPLPTGLWAGFAADERGLEVRTFRLPAKGSADSVALAQVVLEPFRPALERAERVRVLPYGLLRLVDFHTLPFGGEPLLARHVVVYGLDLPARSFPVDMDRRTALLVADPQGDLAAARQEASVVAAAVRTWKPGWTLKPLEGTAARAEDVRAALPDAGLFHYAGHGTFAGFAGWDSVLPLADGSSLTLGDLLALPRAPAWVLLSSCDAARSSEQAPGEGIGLAHAFLLAGSQFVIAATREVPDRTARDLLSELYRGWQPGVDLPREFQRAQQICSHSHSASDCASFRLLEP